MGWWSRLFGRGVVVAPPSRALAAAATAEQPPAAAPEPALLEDSGDISPARLDAALQRLREEHPEGPPS